ncbi:MAG: LptA/OstA family protein [Alphaproteobacteria bacterium]|jgi:lipopolysaccharide transport protein LptA|tara:strand:- start:90 stop:581 length:492 start_codon:yes stop_codon:yes gene_type:complete
MLFSFLLTDIGLSEEGNNFSVERDEPYEITSENMFIEREQKTIGFSGNVILKQGAAYLTADQIELFFDNNFNQEGFYKMLASGNILIKNNDSTSITGNLATYNVSDEKIIMTENVILKNQMSMIKGNKLILDINSGKIEIFDDKLDQERVKGVLVDQSNKEEQ